ncbi:hypothetical protein CEXT_599831 [Caerostris extrusa]|uniref:Uncharacterized protein n=1 Tax=Caerostris extrusa TaxID=172846 RepID=A0AAV4Y5Z6_CAEEX|nr:hypothetical protein CEXT_599831 [Caerostris extrusa]
MVIVFKIWGAKRRSSIPTYFYGLTLFRLKFQSVLQFCPPPFFSHSNLVALAWDVGKKKTAAWNLQEIIKIVAVHVTGTTTTSGLGVKLRFGNVGLIIEQSPLFLSLTLEFFISFSQKKKKKSIPLKNSLTFPGRIATLYSILNHTQYITN